MNLSDIINNISVKITLQTLTVDQNLLENIQTQLYALGLYLGRVDGLFGPKTDAAISEFCEITNLPKLGSSNFNSQRFAQLLLNISEVVPSILVRAQNRALIFNKFKKIEDDMFAGQQADELNFAFLDRGINEVLPASMPTLPKRQISESPYKKEIPKYSNYLQQKPNGVSLLTHPISSGKFAKYPIREQNPTIENNGLDFLSSDISHACICVGGFHPTSGLVARWLGRKALENVQFWSATKFVPMLNLVCQANRENDKVRIGDCNIKGSAEKVGVKFNDLIFDVVSYRKGTDYSNQVATMFKRFKTDPYPNLETWIMHISGNRSVQFQGGYTSSGPFRVFPTLFSRDTGEVLVEFQEPNAGANQISAYDLVRFISMLGWHNYLPQDAQLPGAQWHSLASIVQAMGTDTARYVDVALGTLGLKQFISSPVIISKLGFGTTGHGEDALTYVALVQFNDDRLKLRKQPSKLRTLAMALRIPTSVAIAHTHDARMAAEVTEIIRRVVMEEIA